MPAKPETMTGKKTEIDKLVEEIADMDEDIALLEEGACPFKQSETVIVNLTEHNANKDAIEFVTKPEASAFARVSPPMLVL